MRASSFLGLVVAASLFCLGAARPSQTVTVRVHLIYLRSGKPAKGQRIILYLDAVDRIPRKVWEVGGDQLEGTTSPDGIVAFRLPKPPPRRVWLDLGNGRIEPCASPPAAPLLEDVLEHGVTIGVDQRYGKSCKGDRGLIRKLAAKPGELVIFVRNLTWWDNLREY